MEINFIILFLNLILYRVSDFNPTRHYLMLLYLLIKWSIIFPMTGIYDSMITLLLEGFLFSLPSLPSRVSIKSGTPISPFPLYSSWSDSLCWRGSKWEQPICSVNHWSSKTTERAPHVLSRLFTGDPKRLDRRRDCL